MKRWLLIILLVAVALSAGCASKTGSYTFDELSLTNQKGQVLKYDMDRDEVEKILGKGVQSSDRNNCIIYGNDATEIEVIYRENKAVLIDYRLIDYDSSLELIESKGDTLDIWKTSRDIVLGSSKDNLFEAYNMTEHPRASKGYYCVFLSIDGKKLTQQPDPFSYPEDKYEEWENENGVIRYDYTIAFWLGKGFFEEKEIIPYVSHITIADERAMMGLQ